MNAPTSLELAGYRVAVVDDNRNFRDLLRTMLRAFGVRRVDSIAEPDEAIPFLCQNFVDLIFVDLVMPGVDGIRLAREIRHKAGIAKRTAPIVLVTGHASRDTVVRAIAAGIDDIIVKPLSPQTILRRTRRLLLKPVHYVSGLDGYYGPDVIERRRSVERRMSADRWRLMKTQPYQFIGAPLTPPALPRPLPDATRAPLATPVVLSPTDPGTALPGLNARAGAAKPSAPGTAPAPSVKPPPTKSAAVRPAAGPSGPAVKPASPSGPVGGAPAVKAADRRAAPPSKAARAPTRGDLP